MVANDDVTSSSPLSSGVSARGKKVHVDLSNPAFRKPMEYGWKRELVYRNTSDSSGLKRMADIYYYTPLGKKVRSNREVIENLVGEDLTLDNFTFFKEPLGLDDPTKEIIRVAKRVATKEAFGAPPKKLVKASKTTPTKEPKEPSNDAATPEQQEHQLGKPVVVLNKDAVNIPSPKEPSPVPGAAAPTPKQKPASRAFPRVKVTPVRSQRKSQNVTPNTTPTSKTPASSRSKKDPNTSGELVMGMLPPQWKDPTSVPNKKSTSLTPGSANTSPQVSPAPPAGAKVALPTPSSLSKNSPRSSTAKMGKKMESPCSIQCLGQMGIIPSLQCRVCLCLYHPECVGLGPLTDTIHCYVCKKCQQVLKEGKSTASTPKLADKNIVTKVTSTTPPPLTPISTLGSVSNNNKASTSNASSNVQSTSPGSTPPKLQRLPRTNDASGKLQMVPRYVKVTCQDARPAGNVVTAVSSATSGSANSASKKTNIVGSVTTWLPSSSTIQINSAASVPYKTADTATSSKVQAAVVAPASIPEADAEQDPLNAQGLLRMEGRRYIVVQKHNVLSVSPPAAPTPAPKLGATLGEGTSFTDRPAPFALGAGGLVIGSLPPPSASTVNRQGIMNRPQILFTTAPGVGAQPVPRPSSSATVTSGSSILPKPTTTFLMGTGSGPRLQNPPGVILVPVVPNASMNSTAGGEGSNAPQQQQFVLVNAPGTGFLFSNLQSTQQQVANVTATATSTASATITTAATGTKVTAVKQTKEVISEEVRAKRIESERQFMQFFMQNLGAGYTALGQVFQYLKVQELLRAGRVCRMWKDLASQASLWRTVRMKNSQVVNWKGCADALRRYGTEELDLRKMLIPGKAIAMWDEFCSVVGTIPSLRRLELCKCPADVLDRIAAQCPQLQSLTALSVKCSAIDLQFVQNFKNLQELRLKSIQGIDLMCSLDVLKNLTNLKHLSLTTFKEFGRKNPNVIGSITSLESLELGDFCDFPDSFGQSLTNLTNLQRLRLEKGQGKMCPTFKVLAGIRTLPRLTQLELVNFDIKPGFDVALEQCTNIRRLLIIPTYVSQSATTNHMVLGGVTKLGGSLVDFVWGVTHELLRVTELFVDQCEGQKGARVAPKDNKKNGTSDSIPVLKPVPGLVVDSLSENGSDSKGADSKQKAPREEISDENKTSAATQQVDIVPLSELQMLLTNALPNTKVKILKIPFHATWRQSIGEHSH
ncbi:mucin-3B isoform X2 [Anabrus simplex]